MTDEDLAEMLTKMILVGSNNDRIDLILTIRNNRSYIDGALEHIQSPFIKDQLNGLKHLALKTKFKAVREM